MKKKVIHLFTINYKSEHLDDFISSLVPQCPSDLLCVYVLDNSGELDLQRYDYLNSDNFQVRAVKSPKNLGFGRGHNYLFLHFKQYLTPDDWLIIANNDLVLPSGFLSKFVNMIDSDTRAIYSPQIMTSTPDSSEQKLWFSGASVGSLTGGIHFDREPVKGSEKHTQFIPATFIALKAKYFSELKGFSSKFFMYCEDLELCVRATKANIDLIVKPINIVHYVGSGAKGDYSDLFLYENTKNTYYCVRKGIIGVKPFAIAAFYVKHLFLRYVQLMVFSNRPLTQCALVTKGWRDGLSFVKQQTV